MECDALALRDTLSAKCDSPDPLSPSKASASPPPSTSGSQIKELRATAEAAKAPKGGVGRGGENHGQLSPSPLLWPLSLSLT